MKQRHGTPSYRRWWAAMAVIPAGASLVLAGCGLGSNEPSPSAKPVGYIEKSLYSSLGKEYTVFNQKDFSQISKQELNNKIGGAKECPVLAYGAAGVYKEAGSKADGGTATSESLDTVSAVGFTSTEKAESTADKLADELDSGDCTSFDVEGQKVKITSADQDLGLDHQVSYTLVVDGHRTTNVVGTAGPYVIMVGSPTKKSKAQIEKLTELLTKPEESSAQSSGS